jgi:hypothetical protein
VAKLKLLRFLAPLFRSLFGKPINFSYLINKRWDCSVGMATRYGLDGGVLFPAGARGLFLCFTAPKKALGCTHSPIQLIPWLKLLEREADHSPPSSAEVKNSGAMPSLHIRLHGVVLNSLIN